MDFNSIEEKMKKTISVFEENLSEVRAGRANPNILNKNYSRLLWSTNSNKSNGWNICSRTKNDTYSTMDMSMLKEIEKAINLAEIGINPNNDGKVIRLVFPELTEERRKELVKDIRKNCRRSKSCN